MNHAENILNNNPNLDNNETMRLSIITTKQGDGGYSTLSDGKSLPKYHIIMQLMGNIDQTNAQVGLVYAYLKQSDDTIINSINIQQIIEDLGVISQHLFNLGAVLSAPDYVQFKENDLLALEQANAELIKQLSPLKEFILPGTSIIGAHMHVARTTCRQAERDFWQLQHSNIDAQIPSKQIGIYLNRLSDYLFNALRYYHQSIGLQEVHWLNHS